MKCVKGKLFSGAAKGKLFSGAAKIHYQSHRANGDTSTKFGVMVA